MIGWLLDTLPWSRHLHINICTCTSTFFDFIILNYLNQTAYSLIILYLTATFQTRRHGRQNTFNRVHRCDRPKCTPPLVNNINTYSESTYMSPRTTLYIYLFSQQLDQAMKPSGTSWNTLSCSTRASTSSRPVYPQRPSATTSASCMPLTRGSPCTAG